MAKLIDAALEFVKALSELNDARVYAAQNKHDESLYRAAFMLGEDLETKRRILGDAIIEADPTLYDEVRKYVKFSAFAESKGRGDPWPGSVV